MIKITSEKTFLFKINSSTTIEISPEGVIVDKVTANFVKERFGALVTISFIDQEVNLPPMSSTEPTLEVSTQEEVKVETINQPVAETQVETVPATETNQPNV